jgi:hypothetical protein
MNVQGQQRYDESIKGIISHDEIYPFEWKDEFL